MPPIKCLFYVLSTCLNRTGLTEIVLVQIFLFVLTVPCSTISIGTLQGLQERVWCIQNFSVCINWTPLYVLFYVDFDL